MLRLLKWYVGGRMACTHEWEEVDTQIEPRDENSYLTEQDQGVPYQPMPCWQCRSNSESDLPVSMLVRHKHSHYAQLCLDKNWNLIWWWFSVSHSMKCCCCFKVSWMIVMRLAFSLIMILSFGDKAYIIFFKEIFSYDGNKMEDTHVKWYSISLKWCVWNFPTF